MSTFAGLTSSRPVPPDAHAKIARRNTSQVLTDKVSAGSCSEAALELSRKLLYDNPDALFGDGNG